MKIYATDFDNTLNNPPVTAELIGAIAGWRDAGNLFGIISGRPLPSILGMVKEAGIPCDFLLANNGAAMADGDGKLINVHPFLPADAEKLVKYLLDSGHTHIRVDTPFSSDEVSLDGHLTSDRVSRDGEYLIFGDLKLRDVTEITAVFETPECRESAREYVRKMSDGRINPLIPCPTLIDHVSGNIGKNVALHEYIALMGVEPEAVYTTGDAQNDLSMLTDPDFEGYAVPHADPDVIRAVGRVGRPMEILRQYRTISG